MKAQNHSMRSRYKTPLPSPAEVALCEWKRQQNMNRCYDDTTRIDDTRTVDHPLLTTILSDGRASSTRSTKGYQAAIMADSCLPYQRLGRADLQEMAAELDLVNGFSSASPDERLTQETTPSTDSSGDINQKSPSPGQSTDETTPEESPKQSKTVFQPQSLFITPTNQVRRHSKSSMIPKLRTRSSISLSCVGKEESQDRGRLRSISSKPKQQSYRFPVTVGRSSSITSARQNPQEQIIKTRDQCSPEQVKRMPTRQQDPTGIDNFSQPKLTSRNKVQRPSQGNIPQPFTRRKISDASAQSWLIINNSSPHSSEPGMHRSRMSPPPPQTLIRNELLTSAPVFDAPIAARRRSQSAASVKIPFSSPSSPRARNVENSDIERLSVQAVSTTQSQQSKNRSVYPRPKPRSSSAWRPPSVWYENVDGVILSTQPKSTKESSGGLSIPEIEARDIRDIPPFRGHAEQQSGSDSESEFARRNGDYAAPPPAFISDIGKTRSISPRPARKMRDHVFFSNYARAAADEMPNQRANPSRPRKPESISQVGVSIPEIIREMPTSEGESLDDADIESTDSETAMPSKAVRPRSRSHALEEQDAQMTRRTYQIKGLLDGMMKGFSDEVKKDEYKHSRYNPTPDYESYSEDPINSDRGSIIFLDDHDTDSVVSQPNTVIWSPPKSNGLVIRGYVM